MPDKLESLSSADLRAIGHLQATTMTGFEIDATIKSELISHRGCRFLEKRA
jgi:hypothetical protein